MSPAPFDRNRPPDGDDSVRRERTDGAVPRPVDREPPDSVPQPPSYLAPQSPPVSLGQGPVPAGSGAPAARVGRRRRTLAVAAVAVLVVWLLGAPLGLLWRAAAPRVAVVTTDNPALPVLPLQPEQVVAADGWFSLLGLGFGVLVAVGAWFVLRRYRGPVGLVIVALGALGAAVLAWRLGREIGLGDYQRLLAAAPAGETLSKPPDLRAGRFEWLQGIPTLQGDLLLPAFGAAVAYTLLAGWSHYPTLRPEPEPAMLSWGSPAPQTPPAAPGPPAPGGEEPPRD